MHINETIGLFKRRRRHRRITIAPSFMLKPSEIGCCGIHIIAEVRAHAHANLLASGLWVHACVGTHRSHIHTHHAATHTRHPTQRHYNYFSSFACVRCICTCMQYFYAASRPTIRRRTTVCNYCARRRVNVSATVRHENDTRARSRVRPVIYSGVDLSRNHKPLPRAVLAWRARFRVGFRLHGDQSAQCGRVCASERLLATMVAHQLRSHSNTCAACSRVLVHIRMCVCDCGVYFVRVECAENHDKAAARILRTYVRDLRLSTRLRGVAFLLC